VRHQFPPTLQARIAPNRDDQHVALRAALAQLAEQDPLINVCSEPSGELAVSLYGEVQEVIEATLAADYGIAVTFREATPLYIEQPAGALNGAQWRRRRCRSLQSRRSPACKPLLMA
jgi:ribosomal protection tetracycline resistance protein